MKQLTMEPNKLLQISFKEYKEAEGLTRGGIIDLCQNANLFYRTYIKKDFKKEQTPEMILGNLAHAMILEGEELSNYLIMPSSKEKEIWFEENGQRKGGFEKYRKSKFFKPEFWITSDGKMSYAGPIDLNFISLEVAEEAEKLVEFFKKTTYYEKVIKNKKCLKERSIFFTYEDVLIKARMDAIGVFEESKKVIIYDYKTSNAKNNKDILHSIRNYGYDIQAVIYTEAVRRLIDYDLTGYTFEFWLIFQNKANPANISHIVLSDFSHNNFIQDIMKSAHEDFKKAIEEYKEYKKDFQENEWIAKARENEIMMSEFGFPFLLEETKRF